MYEKKKEIKWVKSKTGKFVPCEQKLTRFLVNPYGPVYYTLEGERFHGVEHPTGALLGYKVMPPTEKKTSYRY
jgi:hypothetical protein